jgi:hypothetical protein
VPAHTGQYVLVVFGAHLVLYSQDAEADRRFQAESLGLDSVDAGHGWLIFAMPPSEVAVHPAETAGAGLYLMCDDLAAEMAALAARGVACSAIEEARWGSTTKIALPGRGEIGLSTSRDTVSRSTAARSTEPERATSPSISSTPRRVASRADRNVSRGRE